MGQSMGHVWGNVWGKVERTIRVRNKGLLRQQSSLATASGVSRGGTSLLEVLLRICFLHSFQAGTTVIEDLILIRINFRRYCNV